MNGGCKVHQSIDRIKILPVLVCILLICVLCACIVRPEYLAESDMIPRLAEGSLTEIKTVTTPTPPVNETPVVSPSSAINEQSASSLPTHIPNGGEVDQVQQVGYFFSFLSDEQKQCYLDIKQAFDDLVTIKVLQSDNLDDVIIAYNSLNMDYAKYYYSSSYSFGTQQDGLITIEWGDGEFDTIERELATIIEETDGILALIPDDATEYEKVKLFYEWLCFHLDYEHSDNDQFITSAFIDKKTVCAGYTRAFQYLCNRVGIQCAIAYGIADNRQDPPDSHNWNLVRIDGEYYWVDVTWGDPISSDDSSSHRINYYFLCTTDDFLFRTHLLEPITVILGGTQYVVNDPNCTDESLLYSKNYGLLVGSYDEEVIEQSVVEYMGSSLGNRLILQFRDEDDLSRFMDEILPDLLIRMEKKGLTKYHSYQYTFYDRDGYIEIEFE